MKRFDHIVIGAGSAGCVVAARLAEAGRKVALIEAGKSDEKLVDALDLSKWKNLVGSEHDYDYRIQPQPRGNSTIRHTRGRILGGTSAINTGIAWRTPDYDLKRWGEAGADGWTAEDCAPAFSRLFEKVTLEKGSEANRFQKDLIASANAMGLPLRDFSPQSTVQEGAGYLYFNKIGTMRQSASVAYLHPLAQWGDALTLFTETQAIGLILQGQRVVGVETSDRTLYSDGDLILSCGAFDSPALLLRSGIGSAESIIPHGIDMVHELEGVGQNLLDHPDSMMAWESVEPIPQTDINAMGMALFAKTDPDLAVPDVMMHVGQAVFDTYTKPQGYPTAQNGFSLSPNVARARSKGRVRLRSLSPSDPPVIDFNYFSDPYDEQILVAGLRLARQIVEQSPVRKWVKRELFPGSGVVTDAEMSAYGRKVAGTVYHPAGTCKMGALGDPSTVVDSRLKLCGLDNVRVADASVFPTMIGVNPNMTIMMIGERCADFILSE